MHNERPACACSAPLTLLPLVKLVQLVQLVLFMLPLGIAPSLAACAGPEEEPGEGCASERGIEGSSDDSVWPEENASDIDGEPGLPEETGTGRQDGSDPSGNSPGDPMPEGPPLSSPIAGCAPTPPPPTGDLAADCVTRINQLRRECQNLPPLDRYTEGEQCADAQASYDASRGRAHAGFSDGICFGGSAQNECPGWGGDPHESLMGCLQMMWDEGPGANYWAHGHYLNMTDPRFTVVSCGFDTASGSLWALQNFQ